VESPRRNTEVSRKLIQGSFKSDVCEYVVIAKLSNKATIKARNLKVDFRIVQHFAGCPGAQLMLQGR